MIIKTRRFGHLSVTENELIHFPQGLIGFSANKTFCLIDPGDETLILWLQSLEDISLSCPLLEPKLFKPDYRAHLSIAELRELQLENLNHSAVFSVLTIPADATQMTANLKAPIVINLKSQTAKQVILQESEYGIRHPMFKELQTHFCTLKNQAKPKVIAPSLNHPVAIHELDPSLMVKSL